MAIRRNSVVFAAGLLRSAIGLELVASCYFNYAGFVQITFEIC
jgi:hypothetical protein